MPSEQPNENMDQALKAYAQKRREDSPQIEMDLVTRNMLQAEVKRTLGEVPVLAATRSRPRFGWWPQMIIGVASVAALAIAVLFWKLPSRNEGVGSVVSDESRSIAAADTAIAPSKSEPEIDTFKKDATSEVQESSPAAAPSAVVAEDKLKSSTYDADLAKTAERRDEQKPAELPLVQNSVVAKEIAPTESASTAVPSTLASPPATSSLPSGTVAQAPSFASAAPTATAETPQRTVTLNELSPETSTRLAGKSENAYFDRKQNVAQQPELQQKIRFSQINNRAQYRENLNSPALPKVLTSFGLERTGSNVVVVDADGSKYLGNVVFSNSSGGSQQTYGGNSQVLANGGTSGVGAVPDDSFAFKVSGVNKRLRQKVVFSGSVTNALPNVLDLLNGQQQSLVNQSRNAPNVLLNGRVQVGKTSEFEIQAAPSAAALK